MLIQVTWCGKSHGSHFSECAFIPSLCSPPGSGDGVWVKHPFSDRYHYYYNLETGQGRWEEPEGFHHKGDHLCKDEIQVLLLSQLFCFSLYFHFWLPAFAVFQFNLSLLISNI